MENCRNTGNWKDRQAEFLAVTKLLHMKIRKIENSIAVCSTRLDMEDRNGTIRSINKITQTLTLRENGDRIHRKYSEQVQCACGLSCWRRQSNRKRVSRGDKHNPQTRGAQRLPNRAKDGSRLVKSVRPQKRQPSPSFPPKKS